MRYLCVFVLQTGKVSQSYRKMDTEFLTCKAKGKDLACCMKARHQLTNISAHESLISLADLDLLDLDKLHWQHPVLVVVQTLTEKQGEHFKKKKN